MSEFDINLKSKLDQKTIFKISTDIENFHNVMPDYFESLEVLEKNENELIVFEKIKFLGIKSSIKTKHLIHFPNIHEVFILSGPLNGTHFFEQYNSTENGSVVAIKINLKLNTIFKLVPFIEKFIFRKMFQTTKEFIHSAEIYSIRSNR
jgi:ribosome-associated toxin RatA of RatAB toxin-antitoxin module